MKLSHFLNGEMPILLKIGKVNGKLGPVWPWAKRKKKEVEEEENCKYFVDIAGLYCMEG